MYPTVDVFKHTNSQVRLLTVKNLSHEKGSNIHAYCYDEDGRLHQAAFFVGSKWTHCYSFIFLLLLTQEWLRKKWTGEKKLSVICRGLAWLNSVWLSYMESRKNSIKLIGRMAGGWFLNISTYLGVQLHCLCACGKNSAHSPFWRLIAIFKDRKKYRLNKWMDEYQKKIIGYKCLIVSNSWYYPDYLCRVVIEISVISVITSAVNQTLYIPIFSNLLTYWKGWWVLPWLLWCCWFFHYFIWQEPPDTPKDFSCQTQDMKRVTCSWTEGETYLYGENSPRYTLAKT